MKTNKKIGQMVPPSKKKQKLGPRACTIKHYGFVIYVKLTDFIVS